MGPRPCASRASGLPEGPTFAASSAASGQAAVTASLSAARRPGPGAGSRAADASPQLPRCGRVAAGAEKALVRMVIAKLGAASESSRQDPHLPPRLNGIRRVAPTSHALCTSCPSRTTAVWATRAPAAPLGCADCLLGLYFAERTWRALGCCRVRVKL
ncbi:hypothetical protein GSI_01887 [Ganoderma sinense ZZ0214-1]|uniref:Uncharacterized protein n=1 Tax=Ganoderma sinense ZZ0214-1 TaxID=1077348 RepID=A0A2G8SR31_9APHY|nr:hypothetical protein GSI_01887 [Ganoderma sinense ZZ0214-1]